MPVEPFRHAVAIAHALPGAQLLLDLTHGGQLVVGHDDNADIRPCQFRHVLLAEDVHGELACSRHITHCRLGGDVVNVGPGVYRTGDALAWCFATSLGLAEVQGVVERIDDGLHPALAEEASKVNTVIRPDPCLGVTVVVVFGGAPDVVSDLAGRLAGECLATEVSTLSIVR